MDHESHFCILLLFCYIVLTNQAALDDISTDATSPPLIPCEEGWYFYALDDISTDATSPPLIPCEEGWYFYGNKCYKIFGQRNRISWEDAARSCSGKGGQLATIQTQELQDFLTYFVIYHEREDAWIGLHDRDSESEYQWNDGSVVNYTYWDTGEPSGRKHYQEDCVEMGKWGRTKIGMWNDVPCNLGQSYMCQSDKNKQLNNPDPRFCSFEKGGGWKFFYSCYHLITLKKSWYDAETYCQEKFKGHLITLLNSKAQSFMDYITRKFDKQFWIGIKVQNQYPRRWSSGWRLDFDRWDKNIKEFKEGSCGLRSGENQWTLAPCADEFPFICETHNTPPLLKEVPQGWLCPNSSKDWKDLDGDSCYIFVSNVSLTWDEANYDCMTKGGALVKIQSEEESKTLYPYVIDKDEQLHIGLRRRLDNKNIFQWLDGSDLDYKNWDKDEPYLMNCECGVIWTNSMEWNDHFCSAKYGYICEAKKTPPSIEDKNERPVNDSLQRVCPNYTAEKVVLGVFIFIFVISFIVGIAIYFKKIPSSSWKFLH